MIMESTELVIKRQIEEVLHIRNESIRRYGNVLDELNSIKSGLDGLDSYIDPSSRYGMLNIERYQKELDKRLWNYCFDKLGVFSVMNSRGIDKLRKEIDDKPPEFTTENIQATIEGLYSHRADYFVEGIIDTFRYLSDKHKTNTNDKFKIPDKCVLGWMVEGNWNNGLRLMYKSENQISDIQRTFCMLDKKEFHDRQTICEINDRLKENSTYDNEYFELKGYKNGNIHLKFKRIDLLDQANQLIAEYEGNSLK